MTPSTVLSGDLIDLTISSPLPGVHESNEKEQTAATERHGHHIFERRADSTGKSGMNITSTGAQIKL